MWKVFMQLKIGNTFPPDKTKRYYIPLGTTANKQGRLAGLNMVGQVKEFKGIVGTSIMKFLIYLLVKQGFLKKKRSS